MYLIDDETVQFDIVIPDDTWLGLNLGGDGMDRGDDIIVFQADGADSKFYD